MSMPINLYLLEEWIRTIVMKLMLIIRNASLIPASAEPTGFIHLLSNWKSSIWLVKSQFNNLVANLSSVFFYKQNCLRCMAPLIEHRGRCLEVIEPKPFSKSIAHCLAEYQMDLVDELWDLSDWIHLALTWSSIQSSNLHNPIQVWLPIKRRIQYGPLLPVWPWTRTGWWTIFKWPITGTWKFELLTIQVARISLSLWIEYMYRTCSGCPR